MSSAASRIASASESSSSNTGSGRSSMFSLGKGNGNGSGNGGKKRKRGFFRRVGRFTLWTVVLAGGVTYYCACPSLLLVSLAEVLTYCVCSLLLRAADIWQSQNPPDQLPQDPSKKTVVVLGSGWAATSFLKNIVRSFCLFSRLKEAEC